MVILLAAGETGLGSSLQRQLIAYHVSASVSIWIGRAAPACVHLHTIVFLY